VLLDLEPPGRDRCRVSSYRFKIHSYTQGSAIAFAPLSIRALMEPNGFAARFGEVKE
jgi:hypothetical protein